MNESPIQHDLFAEVEEDQAASVIDFETPLPRHEPFRHTPESIRAMLTDLIKELRGAQELPWDARTLRGHRAMAPYMAEWLKGGEGDRLLAEFRSELVRLGEAPKNDPTGT